jgi:hypothetical protein
MTRDTEQNVQKCAFENGACIHCKATERGDCQGWVSSPKRPWVGLTESERNDLEDYLKMTIGKTAFDAIEAKLKEKNT